MSENLVAPVYLCECGARTPLQEQVRIGDGLRCDGCDRHRVVLRSRIEGALPQSLGSGRLLSADDRAEVDDAWDSIKRRRAERQPRPVGLYRSRWVFLLGIVAPPLGAYIAAENMGQLGSPNEGRRLFVATSVVTGLAALCLSFYGSEIGRAGGWSLCLGLAFVLALVSTLRQARASAVGNIVRSAPRSALVPLLFGVLIGIVEGFVASFLLGALD